MVDKTRPSSYREY